MFLLGANDARREHLSICAWTATGSGWPWLLNDHGKLLEHQEDSQVTCPVPQGYQIYPNMKGFARNSVSLFGKEMVGQSLRAMSRIRLVTPGSEEGSTLPANDASETRSKRL